jgi:hypothetical protein
MVGQEWICLLSWSYADGKGNQTRKRFCEETVVQRLPGTISVLEGRLSFFSAGSARVIFHLGSVLRASLYAPSVLNLLLPSG